MGLSIPFCTLPIIIMIDLCKYDIKWTLMEIFETKGLS